LLGNSIITAMKTWGITFFLALALSLQGQVLTVTNTNDSGPGSLRQAITDANANWSIDRIEFNIPTSDAGYNASTGVFTILVTSAELPSINNRVLTIDGSTQTAFTGNTNTTIFGAGGTVGCDAVALAQVDGPEIEIVDGAGNLKWGLQATERYITINDLAIHSFGNGWFIYDNANLLVRGGGGYFEAFNMVLGSEAHQDMAPAGSDINGAPNFQALGVDDGKFHHNYVAYGSTMGGFLRTGCANWEVYQNDFAHNGLVDQITDGLDVADFTENCVVKENLFRNNGANGLDTYNSHGGHQIENNTSYNNGRLGNETSGMRIYGGYGDTITKNLIYDNVGAGILVTSAAEKHHITQNCIYNNGNVIPAVAPLTTSKQLGIDLLSSSDNHRKGTGTYVTLNDNNDVDAGGNQLQNFPIIDAVIINGANLTVKGFAPAGATVEFFEADQYAGAYMPQGKSFLFSKVEGSGDDMDASTGSYGPGLVNGIAQGTESNANRFEFTVPVPAGFVAGDAITATSFLTANGTSEFCGAFTAVNGSGTLNVNPELNCVYIDVNNDVVAKFGYHNPNNFTVNIPVGANNSFSPSPQGRGQNTSFIAGTHSNEFTVTFPSISALSWYLDGTTVTADINSVRCPADLQVTQTVTNNTPNVGDQVTFTIHIDNLTCGVPATAVQIQYAIDANFTYVSHAGPSSGSYNAGTGLWTIPEVVCGTGQSLQVTVQVNGNGSNTASVLSQNQPDPVSSNNSASENCATGSSGSNNGGIESEGSMARLIAARNYERIIRGQHTFYDRIAQQPTLSDMQSQQLGKTGALSDYLPAVGPQNAPAVIATPTDLIGITNALNVFSVDYLNTAQNRLGSILAIETQNEVYNHTKVICDRLNGATLENIKLINIKGHTFILSHLDQGEGLVDMAVTFVAYKKANGSIEIDARWNQQEYDIQPSDKVYNFQVWSVSESLTRQLVEDILTLMEMDGPVSSLTSSNVAVPTAYVKTGHYEDGKIFLTMVNTVGASEINIMANRTINEQATRTQFGELISLDPAKNEETVVWNTGYLFDSGFEILNDIGGGRDVLYLADGAWGVDFERVVGANSTNFNTLTESGYTFDSSKKHLERDVQFTGNLKNYVSIYRMLRPGHKSVDLSAYNQMTFEASLSGLNEIIVTLVSGDITNWSEQYRITVPVQNAAMGTYSIDFADLVSAGNTPLDLSNILNVTFSIVGDYNSFVPVSFDIANVEFNSNGNPVSTAEYGQVQNGLNVYPNPFSGAAQIDLHLDNSSDVRVELYDLSGKMVDQAALGFQFKGTNTMVYQPQAELLEGVYLMKVITDNRSYTQKVVYRK